MTYRASWLLGMTLVLAPVVSACGDNGGDDNDEHCDNAVRDGDETGVDCGGSCGACDPAPVCGDGTVDPGEDCDQSTPGCDDACHFADIVVADFEGDNSAWELVGGTITFDADATTTSTAMAMQTPADGCGSAIANLNIDIPAGFAAIDFDLHGDLSDTGGTNQQTWMLLGDFIAGPALPVTATLRHEHWCLDDALLGTNARLQFAVRTQNACAPIGIVVDDVTLVRDGTDCQAMEPLD